MDEDVSQPARSSHEDDLSEKFRQLLAKNNLTA